MASSTPSSPEIILPPNEGDEHIRLVRVPEGGLPDVDAGDIRLFNEIDAELVFQGVEEELKTKIADLGPELTGINSKLTPEDVLDREKSFFTKIFVAATDMADSQEGPVTLMFDLDLNLIKNGTVRPSFGLLVKELGNILEDRLEIGILTSRGADVDNDTLKSLLVAPIANVPGVAERINPDFVLSSRNLDRKEGPESETDLLEGDDNEAKIEAAKDILNPAVIEGIRQGKIDSKTFYDSKLIILQRLIPRHPNRGFIVSDDIPYVSFIRDDRGLLKGIWTRDEILSGIIKSASNPQDSDNERSVPLAA